MHLSNGNSDVLFLFYIVILIINQEIWKYRLLCNCRVPELLLFYILIYLKNHANFLTYVNFLAFYSLFSKMSVIYSLEIFYGLLSSYPKTTQGNISTLIKHNGGIEYVQVRFPLISKTDLNLQTKCNAVLGRRLT